MLHLGAAETVTHLRVHARALNVGQRRRYPIVQWRNLTHRLRTIPTHLRKTFTSMEAAALCSAQAAASRAAASRRSSPLASAARASASCSAVFLASRSFRRGRRRQKKRTRNGKRSAHTHHLVAAFQRLDTSKHCACGELFVGRLLAPQKTQPKMVQSDGVVTRSCLATKKKHGCCFQGGGSCVTSKKTENTVRNLIDAV